MKIVLFSIICIVILSACNTQPDTQEKYPLKSFELGGPFMKDTINILDASNRKQGLWIIPKSKDTLVYKNDTGYSTQGHTFREVVKMLNAGQLQLFISYDSLTVKSE